jgi:hypothetical protein
VALWLALTKGLLVSALHTYDFLALFPIHPLTLARYREVCTPSRAKDALTDVALPLALLLPHRATLQPRQPQSPTMRALAPLGAHQRRVVGDPGRLTNRLTRTLKHSCPQVRHWLQDQDTAIYCAVLRRWPTLTAAQRARRSTRATFFRAPHGRSAEVMAPRSAAITSAIPRTTAAGVSAPHALLGHALVAQPRGPLPDIADLDTAIAQRAQRHPDGPLFQRLPGAGPVVASRLLVAFGEHRERSAAAAALQT